MIMYRLNFWTYLPGKMHSLVLILFSVLPTHTYMSGETSYRYLTDDTLRVTSVILEPYMMLNPDYIHHSGVPRYIGYVPDLMSEISRILAIDHVITTASDNSFGYKRNDGSWDGMVGELVGQKADIAAGPMYKTSQRARAADFTIPYMNVDATLLLRKSPAGTDFQIRSIEDLLNQSEIQYGTLGRGIIIRAFKSTNVTALKIMWRNMLRFEPTTFTDTNEEGIDRVRTEKYGFVIPHTIGEYMSMQQPCDLITVDRFLLDRGYSLAVQRGSQLLAKLNRTIKVLKDSGKLSDLYRKWWVGQSQCTGSKSSKMHGIPLASTARAPPRESHIVTILASLVVALCCPFVIRIS